MNKIQKITVEQYKGAPCFHVDGEPQTGLAFWHMSLPSGKEEWQEFARCGVHFFQLDINAWSDPADWDERLSYTIEADPKAKIWLRTNTLPPQEWLDAHPEHVQVHYDENNGDRIEKSVAFASPLWREEASANLKRFVEYMESNFGDRVWAYNIQAGGTCGEWEYSWSPVCSGYAPIQVTAWRDWLRERYSDTVALQEAWQDSDVDFANAAPPAWSERTRAKTWPPQSQIIDAATERRTVDWLSFHGTAQSTALAELAAATRSALDEKGHRKLISAFNGYHFFPYGAAYGPCNTGFSNLEPVLNSPDVDALCTPLGYIHRNPGGLYNHHNLAATLRLHGKLFYTEDDTFTHRAKWTPWRYCCQDAEDTLNILRRNLAGALSEGATQWWMDHDSGNWYTDEETEAGIANMVCLAEEAFTRDRSSCAEVALITSEASFRILRQSPELIDQLWPKTQTELLRIGAPIDLVRIQDLGLAEANGDTARWKFVIVSGCLLMTPAERELLQQTLFGNGRHILFLHGQGICDGERNDLAFTSELLGIELQEYPHSHACRGETMLDGAQLSWGTDKEISPILYTEDNDVEVLGWLERQYYPTLVRKECVDYTILWSGVPGLPWQLLGQFAETVGVHRYLTDGSQVMANSGLLAIHPAGDGPQTLRLPHAEALVDALDDSQTPSTAELLLELHRGETRIWFRESGKLRKK